MFSPSSSPPPWGLALGVCRGRSLVCVGVHRTGLTESPLTCKQLSEFSRYQDIIQPPGSSLLSVGQWGVLDTVCLEDVRVDSHVNANPSTSAPSWPFLREVSGTVQSQTIGPTWVSGRMRPGTMSLAFPPLLTPACQLHHSIKNFLQSLCFPWGTARCYLLPWRIPTFPGYSLRRGSDPKCLGSMVKTLSKSGDLFIEFWLEVAGQGKRETRTLLSNNSMRRTLWPNGHFLRETMKVSKGPANG